MFSKKPYQKALNSKIKPSSFKSKKYEILLFCFVNLLTKNWHIFLLNIGITYNMWIKISAWNNWCDLRITVNTWLLWVHPGDASLIWLLPILRAPFWKKWGQQVMICTTRTYNPGTGDGRQRQQRQRQVFVGIPWRAQPSKKLYSAVAHPLAWSSLGKWECRTLTDIEADRQREDSK